MGKTPASSAFARSTVAEAQNHSIGFWAGYRLWLAHNRRLLALALGMVLIGFAVALWISRAPADPFAYGDFQ